jgi:hypothetical protein
MPGELDSIVANVATSVIARLDAAAAGISATRASRWRVTPCTFARCACRVRGPANPPYECSQRRERPAASMRFLVDTNRPWARDCRGAVPVQRLKAWVNALTSR